MKKIWQRIRQSTFFVKWTNWEYYPLLVSNIPIIFIWLYFAIRSRSLFYFSTVNPVIETGGVLGESKMNILKRIPKEYLPKTIFIKKASTSVKSVLAVIESHQISFPLIFKPDIGERGFLVEKIDNEKDVENYLKSITVDFIIQDFVELPVEISVLYYRIPDEQKGKITSVCLKKNLTVIGDGKSTIETLMQNYPRARFQLSRFRKNYPHLLQHIPRQGEAVELEPIGNHSRGTTFLDANHLIDEELEKVFDEIALPMKDIYYGRFDMKCKNIELLKQGKHIKILEFNGIASDPAHIYDPKYSFRKAYKDVYQHGKIIYKISKIQRKKGVRPMTLREAYSSYRIYTKYMKAAKN